MPLYTCRDFRGFWPVGSAAVIQATDASEAERLLRSALADHGLPKKDEETLTLVLWKSVDEPVRIVCDGNY